VEPGPGSRLPRQKLGTKINQSFKLYIFLFILSIYFYFSTNNYYSHLDLLAPEEGEEDATPLGEEEAMRILEQQNDEEEQEKGDTPKPGTSTDPDAGAVTAPPPPPPVGAAATGGADPSGQAADPSSGHHSQHYQKRAASPGSHGSVKRTRTGSLSSCTTTRTSNFMPPLYYTTLNKRENAITPRVLGGGKTLLLRGVLEPLPVIHDTL
jgi:hypothetical protein